MGAHTARARSAAVAAASAQAGTDAGAGKEPVAAYCLEPGAAEEVATVDGKGTGAAEEAGAGALDGAAAERSAAAAGVAERILRRSGCGSGAGGAATSCSAPVDDASRDRTGNQFGGRADPGRGQAALRKQSQAGQLPGTESLRGLQRRAASAGLDQ